MICLVRILKTDSQKRNRMKLTKNFSKREFDCNDGSEMPNKVLERIKLLSEQ